MNWWVDATIVAAGVGYVFGVWLCCNFDARKQARRRAAERLQNEQRRARDRASWARASRP